ncbi:hypothetical protein Tco_0311424 [Tanacetum coccineum]
MYELHVCHKNASIQRYSFPSLDHIYCVQDLVNDSLLLTPLCCDDIHDVTPRVFALAGYDRFGIRASGYKEVVLFRPTGYSIAYDSKEEPIEEEPLEEPNEEGDVRTLMMDEAYASRYLVHSRADKAYYNLRDMCGGHVWRRILLPMLPRSSSGYDTNWVIVDRLTKRCMEGSVGHMFFGLKLEKFGRLDQNWYNRQQIRVEVGDKVMLEVSSWKDVVHFGKKEILAPRYKYLANTNLHVHLEEIKVDKTLRFVEEPVEIIDREVKSLKRSRILIVKSIGTRSEVMRIS